MIMIVLQLTLTKKITLKKEDSSVWNEDENHEIDSDSENGKHKVMRGTKTSNKHIHNNRNSEQELKDNELSCDSEDDNETLMLINFKLEQ